MAAFLGAAQVEQVQLLPNATAIDAASAAMWHMPPLVRNDRVVILEGTRPDLVSLLERACRRGGAELVVVDPGWLTMSTGTRASASASALAAVEAHVSSSPYPVRLAVFEHTGLWTGFRAPTAQLSELCKAHDPGTMVMVDGSFAHVADAPDLASAEHVDFYLAECHRFMSAPAAVTVLWTRSRGRSATDVRHGADMVPSVLAAGDHALPVVEPAVPDYSAALSLPAALDFWRTVGTWHSVNAKPILSWRQRHAVCVAAC